MAAQPPVTRNELVHKTMGVYEDLLVADFQQCFQHMRHYDESLRKILEFSITGTVAVLAACAAIARNGFSLRVLVALSVILLLSSCCSAILSIAAVRNRVYFSLVCRYVNEIRGLYLSRTTAGIRNLAGMYADYRFPAVLSPVSTQTLQFYVLTLAFSGIFALGCGAAYAATSSSRGQAPVWNWTLGLSAFGGFAVVQVGLSFVYWYTKRQKLGNPPKSGKETQ